MNTNDDNNEPGKTIFDLGDKRYIKSLWLEFIAYILIGMSLATAYYLSTAENVGFIDGLPIKIIACLLPICVISALKLRRRANNAYKGAMAESEVGYILRKHCKEVKHNIRIPYYGDIDNVARTFGDILYVVDAKAFPAKLTTDSDGRIQLHESQHQFIFDANGQAWEMSKISRKKGMNVYYNVVVCFKHLNLNGTHLFQKVMDKNGKTKTAYITSNSKICAMLDYLDRENSAR